MLKHIEKVQLFCTWRDASITFDDGKTFPKGDPRIGKFTRRKRKPMKVTAKFTIGLTIGRWTDTVPDPSLETPIVIPIKNSSSPIEDILKERAARVIKETLIDKAADEPIRFKFNGEMLGEAYWLFENKFYKDTDRLQADEVKALLLTRKRMRKARINRAKTIASTPETPVEAMRRGFIPEDIRLLVWDRDGGKCVKCGSRNELQFDHIIPFSLGGGSTEDNLQILCGSCNRAKSNSIA